MHTFRLRHSHVYTARDDPTPDRYRLACSDSAGQANKQAVNVTDRQPDFPILNKFYMLNYGFTTL